MPVLMVSAEKREKLDYKRKSEEKGNVTEEHKMFLLWPVSHQRTHKNTHLNMINGHFQAQTLHAYTSNHTHGITMTESRKFD